MIIHYLQEVWKTPGTLWGEKKRAWEWFTGCLWITANGLPHEMSGHSRICLRNLLLLFFLLFLFSFIELSLANKTVKYLKCTTWWYETRIHCEWTLLLFRICLCSTHKWTVLKVVKNLFFSSLLMHFFFPWKLRLQTHLTECILGAC